MDLIQLHVIAPNDVPRVLDTDLAERLGFDRPRVVRELIDRNREELEAFGPLAVQHGKSRGQAFTANYLNEEQALLVATLSRTEKAKTVRAMLIKVFVAWRRGELSGDGRVSEEVGRLHEAIMAMHREMQELRLRVDDRTGAVTDRSVREVLDDAGAEPRGRNSLNRRLGNHLRRLALARGIALKTCSRTGTYLFPIALLNEVMKAVGDAWVADHNAAVTGQGVIRFPDRRRKTPDIHDAPPPL